MRCLSLQPAFKETGNLVSSVRRSLVGSGLVSYALSFADLFARAPAFVDKVE